MTREEILAACPTLADRPEAVEEVLKLVYSLENTICRNPCAAHGNEGTAEGCFECMFGVAGLHGAEAFRADVMAGADIERNGKLYRQVEVVRGTGKTADERSTLLSRFAAVLKKMGSEAPAESPERKGK
jgi:hypothetical protein